MGKKKNMNISSSNFIYISNPKKQIADTSSPIITAIPLSCKNFIL